ncbi:hypothetical protein K9M41_00700 [Candidatus Gracilibacteria bacterium]|nr:hypothetical protein [Candidatus Gracilibacteria bacterium]
MKNLFFVLICLPLLWVGLCSAADDEDNIYDRKAEAMELECNPKPTVNPPVVNIEPSTQKACLALKSALEELGPLYLTYKTALDAHRDKFKADIERINGWKEYIKEQEALKIEKEKAGKNTTDIEINIEAKNESIKNLENEIQKARDIIEFGEDGKRGEPGDGEKFRQQEQYVNDLTLTYLGLRTSHFDVDVLSAAEGSNESKLNLVLGGGEIGRNVLYKAIRIMARGLGTFAVLILIVGGLMMITSEGDENRLQKGKNIVFYTLIGLVVAFIAYIMVQFIISILFTSTV